MTETPAPAGIYVTARVGALAPPIAVQHPLNVKPLRHATARVAALSLTSPADLRAMIAILARTAMSATGPGPVRARPRFAPHPLLLPASASRFRVSITPPGPATPPAASASSRTTISPAPCAGVGVVTRSPGSAPLIPAAGSPAPALRVPAATKAAERAPAALAFTPRRLLERAARPPTHA